MIKKLLAALVFVIGIQFLCNGFFFMLPTVFAQTPDNTAVDGSATSPGFMFDLTPITHEAITGTTRQSWIREGINYFFKRGISVMASVIGSLSVLMLSIGGFMMLASAGDETTYEKGKNYATYALIGLGVTLLAYVMVSLVQILISSIYA